MTPKLNHFFILSSPSSSTSAVPPLMKGEEPRNWAELPPELTASILIRLSVIDILENAQKVCRSWRRVCKDPSMWRKIDMRDLGYLDYDLEAMYRHAVDLSQGGLLEVNMEDFESNSLLTYIADRSSQLRRLGVYYSGQITSAGIIEAIVKLPLLEEIEISYWSIEEQHLKAVGQSCLNLKTLKLNCMGGFESCDKVAQAIAETMPGLRHLQLFRNGLSDTGLNAILDGCPHLKKLGLHKCLNINLVGNLGK